VKFHSPEVSELEGVFSRGDARLADVILRAYRHGARFDAWTEAFRPDAWAKAFAEAAVDPLEYLRERDLSVPLPWDVVDAGIDREFLLAERVKARAGETTPTAAPPGAPPAGRALRASPTSLARPPPAPRSAGRTGEAGREGGAPHATRSGSATRRKGRRGTSAA